MPALIDNCTHDVSEVQHLIGVLDSERGATRRPKPSRRWRSGLFTAILWSAVICSGSEAPVSRYARESPTLIHVTNVPVCPFPPFPLCFAKPLPQQATCFAMADSDFLIPDLLCMHADMFLGPSVQSEAMLGSLTIMSAAPQPTRA